MTERLLDMTGRRILITGGCGALGVAIVKMLVEHGAKVAVNDVVSEEDARAILPETKAVVYVRGDSSTVDQAEKMFTEAQNLLGALPDTVLCHAGIVHSYPIEQYPEDVFDRIIDTNLRATFFVGRTASSAWVAEGSPGHLVFTSSWVADTPWPGIAPYSATKSAVNALMRSFARELAPYGIRSNSVAPGIVGAGMAQHQWDTEPDYRARAEKAIPIGELQSLESVANTFLYICSSLASYMTGSVLTVDGGCSLYPMD